MKNTFSNKSQGELQTLHPDLRFVLEQAIKVIDFSVVEGYRNMAKQNKYLKEGKSQLQYPDSKHNKRPCEAVDIIPHPLGYEASKETLSFLAGHIFAIAGRHDIKIIWGGHWRDFPDYYHFELETV